MDPIKYIISFIVCANLVANVSAVEPVTEKNWVNHPEIKRIRVLFKEINSEKDAGAFDKKEQSHGYCVPYEDTARTLYLDKNGKGRLYAYEGGSGDSMVRTELYYSESGVRRFAFIKAGAVNGTELQHRVYFSESGEKIWEIQKLIKGPGYTFPHEWQEERLHRDPIKAFNKKIPCPD